MTGSTPYPDGEEEHDDNAEADDSASSPVEQAKERERELEESGEENAA
jgi:hypothetical protein